MVLLEVVILIAVVSILAILVAGFLGLIKPPPPPRPTTRLMAQLIYPIPFPSTLRGSTLLNVLVLTVTDGTFAPEVGASVTFSLSTGDASVDGARTVTLTTDNTGGVNPRLAAVRTGRDELIISVTARGISMGVAQPIPFETVV